MRASFGSGPLIFSPRGLGFDVKISRSGGEGICPFWRYPLTSVAATRLSQLSDLRYISRDAFRDTISLQLTAVLWCLFSQSTTDRIGKVLGGALTHTQIINLHINSHGSVCFRFNFCVWNIDDSTRFICLTRHSTCAHIDLVVLVYHSSLSVLFSVAPPNYS